MFLTQLAIKYLFKFSPHPMSVSALPGKTRPSKIRVEINEKTSKNSIDADLWHQQPIDYSVCLSCSSVSTR